MSQDSHVPAGYGLALSRRRREERQDLRLSSTSSAFPTVSPSKAVGNDNFHADNETLRRR